jgi:predicted metal-dependent phosphoesterase TrpH
LHTHTYYSDGLDTPAQLVTKAAGQALRSIAVTDHDTVEGLPEAQQAGAACGVEVLTGVELSVQYQQHDDIHLLGYFFDPQHAALCARLADMQQGRVQRGLEILACVNRLLTQQGRQPLDSTRVLQNARGALARPHLAQELIAQGYASTMQDAFRDFLIPCNAPKAHFSPEDAFDLIAQAGGVCSLAHPGTLDTDQQGMYALLAAFKAMGLVGLEVYHHYHYPHTMDFFQACATRYGLVATGGSDYHGRPVGAVLGQIAPEYAVPDHTLHNLRRAYAGRAGIGLTH